MPTNPTRTIGHLFEDPPATWGLRGDPYLWAALRDQLAATPMPANATELEEHLAQAFHELTGHPVAAPEQFHVQGFAHGGMSSGYIEPSFWREEAIPLLINRFENFRP